MSETTNDNEAQPVGIHPEAGDRAGQAAILLVESLIHGLIDCEIIGTKDAVEIVDLAVETEAAHESDSHMDGEVRPSSLGLLKQIRDSLRTDLSE